MNDKIIINTISKIHFILVSAISFIILILFSMFILLQNGVYIDDVSLPSIKAKKLYIKWDEKISVVVDELHIIKTKTKTKKIDYDALIKNIEKNLIFSSWFELIRVKKISFNDIEGSFLYQDSEKGYLNLSSPDFLFSSTFYSNSNVFKIKIDKLKSKHKNIKTAGEIVFKLDDGLKFKSSLMININNDAKLNLKITGDEKKLSYSLNSDVDIIDTKYIIDLFDINPKAKYWFYDAMTLSSLSIESINGWLEYKNLSKAYLNLHAKVVANDLIYTYDKKVASVRTTNTNLEFKKGVLYIRPQNTYSYDFFLDKSWLKIDFSKKEELLTLYLLFKGQLNKDLLSLLNRYKIKLPFIQTKGELDANLKLLINLRTSAVSAVGDFYTREAKINYLGLDLDIFNAHVFLKDTHVKVNDMLAKYNEIASANIDLNFDAKNHKGKLDFRVNKVFFKESGLELKKSIEPLNISYHIAPEQYYIKIDKSTWRFNDKNININNINIPFDIDTLSAKLPLTSLNIEKQLSANISGKILLNPNRLDLDIDLLKFDYNGIKLKQSKLALKLFYDEQLRVATKDTIKLNIGSKEYKLSNAAFNIKNNLFSINNIKINSDDILKSSMSTQYNLDKREGYIDIHDMDFRYKKLGEIFKSDKNIKFNISRKDDILNIKSNEYNIVYLLSDTEWILKFNSVEKIIKNSKIFQEYNFNNGYFAIHKRNSKENIDFLINTEYKYKILTDNDKIIDNYVIKGEVDNFTNNISLNINNSIDVKIADDIKIYASDIGINISQIIDMVNDSNSTNTNAQHKKNIYLDANNCFIYLSDNRHAISEHISLKYTNNILTANLKHKKGEAEFKFENNKFNFYGKDFGDTFMEKLFFLSRFKRGSMNFSIVGTPSEYSGVVYVQNTIIVDYKILNNVLAFVNTIPSLVTFSLPGYSKKGLKVKSSYINFNFKNDVYTMDNIFLHSKEMDIVGKGVASIKKNSINLELNLKTDLGSAISKIPIVGYILMGKESVSTSLTVKGKLDNPKIDTQVAKSIIVAPFNIIKRTLMLPFELFKKDK